ncbi:hypothetical protein CsatB_028485 [Cannabis sativa]
MGKLNQDMREGSVKISGLFFYNDGKYSGEDYTKYASERVLSKAMVILPLDQMNKMKT